MNYKFCADVSSYLNFDKFWNRMILMQINEIGKVDS